MAESNKVMLKLPQLGELTVSIGDSELFDFASRQFTHFVITKSKSNAYCDRYSVSIECINDKLIKKFTEGARLNRTLARNIRIEDAILKSVSRRKFEYITYHWYVKKNLVIDASINYKFHIEKITPLIRDQYSHYHNLFYQLVLYPIFSLYALISTFQLIHGSAIKIKNKTVMIVGLDGVGKSSITEALTHLGGEILSDNFTLFDGNNIVPLILPLRLERKEKTELPVIFNTKWLQEVLPSINYHSSLKVDRIVYLSISDTIQVKEIDQNTEVFMHYLCTGALEVNDANVAILPIHFMKFFIAERTTIKENFPVALQLSLPYGSIEKGATLLTEQLQG